MDALQALMTRKSCRSFEDRQLSDEDLKVILDAGKQAATGGGKQPWKFVVVRNKEVRDKLSAMNAAVMGSDKDPFYGAPCVVVVLTERDRTTAVEDGACAIQNMMVAANAIGVGSCWIHRAYEEFESDEGKTLLKDWGISGDYRGVGHCILGYPQGEMHPDVPRREGIEVFVD